MDPIAQIIATQIAVAHDKMQRANEELNQELREVWAENERLRAALTQTEELFGVHVDIARDVAHKALEG